MFETDDLKSLLYKNFIKVACHS